MKILVTGGAGFIGSNFVRRTLETRPTESIVVLDSLTYAGRLRNLEGLEGKFRFLKGDIRDGKVVDSIVAEVDLVVNFAAETHNDNSLVNTQPFFDSNITGTYELIQACVRHDVRLHHISTDEVFGDMPLGSQTKFTFESRYNPSSPYSASKASADLLIKAWVRSFGLKATVSICSNNYGPYQHEEKLIPRTILLLANGMRPKVYGDGKNVRDWINVKDHIDGIWAVIDRGVSGETYLLGANGERSNIEVVRAILEAMGKHEQDIEFVKDRPGHDLRYSIDATITYEQLNWKPCFTSLEADLPGLVEHYVKFSKSRDFDLQALNHSGLSVTSSK